MALHLWPEKFWVFCLDWTMCFKCAVLLSFCHIASEGNCFLHYLSAQLGPHVKYSCFIEWQSGECGQQHHINTFALDIAASTHLV